MFRDNEEERGRRRRRNVGDTDRERNIEREKGKKYTEHLQMVVGDNEKERGIKRVNKKEGVCGNVTEDKKRGVMYVHT